MVLVAVYRPYPAIESEGVEAGGKAEQEGGEERAERGRLLRYGACTEETRGGKRGKKKKRKRKERKRKKKDTFLERERNAKGVRG